MPHYFLQIEPIPAGKQFLQCQYSWRDGCANVATYRNSVGPEIGYYCHEHFLPPCGGIFFGEFVITPETTRKEVLDGFSGRDRGLRIRTVSGKDVHDLSCHVCGEWVGDINNPEIGHVSISMDTQCPGARASLLTE